MVKRNEDAGMTADEARRHLEQLNRVRPLDGEYTAHGVKFAVSVSPCSWMYKGYGLQFQYRSDDGRAWGYLNNKPLDQKDATATDVQKMLDGLTPGPCHVCKERTFYNPNGNRETHCEQCFIAKLDREVERAQKKEAARVAKEDAKHKKDGFTHKVVAWCHPPRGDDYQLDIYCKGVPTPEEIAAELRQHKSRRVDDYTITAL